MDQVYKGKTDMRIALCRPSYTKVYNFFSEKGINKRDITVPYPLLSLAGHLRKVFGQSVEVRIFDGEVGVKSEEQLLNHIVAWGPDLVGFTVTTPELNRIMELCNQIKSLLAECKVILGGAHITGTKDLKPEYPNVDYVVIGEGEYALEKIVRREMGDGTNPSKTVILEGSDIDLNETGNPDYSLIDVNDYQFIDPMHGFVTANTIFSVRGCPYRCKFCFANRNYRKRNVDDVMAEVKYLYDRGVRHLVFNDETLTLSQARMIEITDSLMSLGYDDLVCVGLTRADTITPDIAERLARANFTRVYVGVESGCDDILKIMNKATSTDKIKRGVDMLRSQDIIVRGSFILGLPYETHETVNRTIQFAKELDIQTAGFNIAMPYPGTELYEMAMNKDGIEFTVDTESPDFYSQFKRWGNCITRTPDLLSDDLINYQKKAIDEFYSQDKVVEFYRSTFESGNLERYWHRTLNHVYKRIHGKDVDWWDQLN